MPFIKRIMIFGRPGSGKSTFALKISQLLGIHVYHLDRYFFIQHWHERNQVEFLNIQATLVHQATWIIDGNSLKSLEMRYAKADVIIYFSYPRLLCLWRIIKRQFYKDPNILDRADGCHERISWSLITYLWTFDKRVQEVLLSLHNKYPQKTIHKISNNKQLDNLFIMLQQES